MDHRLTTVVFRKIQQNGFRRKFSARILEVKMKIEKFLPAEILKPFVKTFVIIEGENGLYNRVLPDTSLVLAFVLKGQITSEDEKIKIDLPVTAMTGLRKSPRQIEYSKGAATLLAIFNDGGAAAFFNESLHELFGTSVSLDNLVRRNKLDEVEERMFEAKNNLQRIAVVERFLLSELKTDQSNRLVFNALKEIKAARGDLRIKDLAKNLNASRDAFEKRFRRTIGTSPKQFASIIRLRNLIDNYSPTVNLTDAAHSAGYFDQSHFIKDFKSFTGQTPHIFFKSAAYW